MRISEGSRMQEGLNKEGENWIDFLYFAYKKAKQFVTRETSFTDHIEIIKFEEELELNIKRLGRLLDEYENNHERLKEKIQEMKGNLYFIPKSFGSNKEARIRPKVSFPFEYQVLWAAVILRIGEWFDTNSQLKNVYSMREERIRRNLDWMVPWSFNGRIKRLVTEKQGDSLGISYIHYNSERLYESHQMALRKFHQYESDVTEKLFQQHSKVYKAELDIQEFFPTLKKKYIKEMFEQRFKELKEINCFNESYFDPEQMNNIINILLDLKIVFPNHIDKDSSIHLHPLLGRYYDKLASSINLKANEQEWETEDNTKDGTVTSEDTTDHLLSILNHTLPLDLIASNFISNCVLNHFVDTAIHSAEKDKNIFILRYTDDYIVISNDKKEVKKIIHQIKKKLREIDLLYSPEKTLPTTVEDVEKRLENLKIENGWGKYYDQIKEWFNLDQYAEEQENPPDMPFPFSKELRKKARMVRIDLEPEEINKNNLDRELTLSRLSTTSDIKLQALSDKELEMHIEELMIHMQTNGNIGELKEETGKIFAAWRLRASHLEKTYRDSYGIEDIRVYLGVLKLAIEKYPYKLGFYDVYVLSLLKVIEHSGTGYKELEAFLLNLKKDIEEASVVDDESGNQDNSKEFLYSCLPTVRIRIINLMADNWKRFDEDERVRLKVILEKAFLVWYAEPTVYWNELYAMYYSFSIMRIRLPLDMCEVENFHPKNLRDIADVYKNYFFLPEKRNQRGQDEEGIDNDNIKVSLAIHMFRKGLYWDRMNRKYGFYEVDRLVYESLKKELKYKKLNPPVSLALARIAPEKLCAGDWRVITNSWELNYSKSNDKEFKFEALDFLQQIIQLFFEDPKKYEEFYKWVKPNQVASDKEKVDKEETTIENSFIEYVRDRFSSYSKIRSYFSVTDDRYTPLPTEEESKIPIADWVFYSQSLPYHLETNQMKQKVLHPLTEYEFVNLLKYISDKENKRNTQTQDDNNQDKGIQDFIKSESLLFYFSIPPSEWVEFRETNKISEPKENNEKIEDNKTSESEEDNEKVEDNKTGEPKENMKKEYTETLFSLLTNRPWHAHVKKEYSMYKWNDLQSYFEMAYYPSTAVATLFVNHLNIHRNFYATLYNMPLEELPYREVYSRKRTENIVEWIRRYLDDQKFNQVYKSDNRKLELLEIDIDGLRG